MISCKHDIRQDREAMCDFICEFNGKRFIITRFNADDHGFWPVSPPASQKMSVSHQVSLMQRIFKGKAFTQIFAGKSIDGSWFVAAENCVHHDEHAAIHDGIHELRAQGAAVEIAGWTLSENS